jgi:hypothetical protein
MLFRVMTFVLLLAAADGASAQTAPVEPGRRTTGSGEAIEAGFRFMHDDKARLRDGRAARAMEEGRRSIESFNALVEAERRARAQAARR